jgi:hypothetical protein
VTLPSSTKPIPTAGGQPDASPQLQPATGLYASPQEALKSISDGYSYWTSKLTESSFALSLAVIGANWAVFGSVDKVLNNICAELSIVAVILSLVISLIGHWYLGGQLRKRIAYAEENTARWTNEFTENVGKSTAWPSTERIDCWAACFRFFKTFLPVIGGVFFFIALLIQPRAQKDESHSGSPASPTPALSSPPTTTSAVKGAPIATMIVAACVCNPDRSPGGINR